MPKISVIVPIYGVENYIKRCARSLFEQTLDDIEFIFIDDCTKDKSMEVLNSVIDEYTFRIEEKRWTVVIDKMQENSGLPNVRRHGISMAKGEYIAHCDSDDWVEPDMFQLMYEEALRSESDIIVCDFSVSDGSKLLNVHSGCGSTDKFSFIRRLLTQKDSWAVWNKLCRRETCYKEDIVYPKVNIGEDMVLTIQLLLNANRISYVPKPLYNYFYNLSSMTRVTTEDKRMNNFWQNKQNVDLVCEILRDSNLENEVAPEQVYNKWHIKRMLWQTTFDNNKRDIWKKCYEEINSKVLLNPYILFKDKMKFILTYLHLYPFEYTK